MNPPPNAQMTELLILADGTIYVHNLTPEMALVLSALNPLDPRMKSRSPRRARNPRRARKPNRVQNQPESPLPL
jgi:hypothetical protein